MLRLMPHNVWNKDDNPLAWAKKGLDCSAKNTGSRLQLRADLGMFHPPFSRRSWCSSSDCRNAKTLPQVFKQLERVGRANAMRTGLVGAGENEVMNTVTETTIGLAHRVGIGRNHNGPGVVHFYLPHATGPGRVAAVWLMDHAETLTELIMDFLGPILWQLYRAKWGCQQSIGRKIFIRL